VLVGLILIAAEVLIVPGFGVPGVLGLAALMGGLFLAMLDWGMPTPESIERAAVIVAVAFIGIVIGGVLIIALLRRGQRFRGLVLQASGAGGSSPAAPHSGAWMDWFGVPSQLPRAMQQHDQTNETPTRTEDRSVGASNDVSR
jgi:hypothetical protein